MSRRAWFVVVARPAHWRRRDRGKWGNSPLFGTYRLSKLRTHELICPPAAKIARSSHVCKIENGPRFLDAATQSPRSDIGGAFWCFSGPRSQFSAALTRIAFTLLTPFSPMPRPLVAPSIHLKPHPYIGRAAGGLASNSRQSPLSSPGPERCRGVSCRRHAGGLSRRYGPRSPLGRYARVDASRHGPRKADRRCRCHVGASTGVFGNAGLGG
jgi:hypothetical protein